MTMHAVKLSGCDTASLNGLTVKARGMAGVIGPLMRAALDRRLVKPFDDVEVWRGGTLCFRARAAIHWASIHTTEGVSSSVKTVVYKPRPDLEADQ